MNTLKQFHLAIPIVLLVVNLVLFSFLVEELLDASPPNYGGGMQLLTPVLASFHFSIFKRRKARSHPAYGFSNL